MLKFLADVNDIKVDYTAPGMPWFHKFLGMLEGYGVYIGVAGLIIGGVIFGVGRAMNAGGHQQKGLGIVGWVGLGIMVITGAGPLVFWVIGQNVFG